jgi:hypothetical protein
MGAIWNWKSLPKGRTKTVFVTSASKIEISVRILIAAHTLFGIYQSEPKQPEIADEEYSPGSLRSHRQVVVRSG